MKKSILMKLLVLAVCAAMLLSLFACDNDVTPTEQPTEQKTEAPTKAPEPSDDPTDEPTQDATQAPTQAPTSEPTQEPTTAPTQEPTTAPTEQPTTEPEVPTNEPEVPTNEPEVPTAEQPTQAPEVPTEEKPTQAPEVPTEEQPTQAPEVPTEEKPTQAPEVPTEEQPTQAPEVPTDPACDGNHNFVAKGDQGHYCDKCGEPSKDNMYDHTYGDVDGVYKCTGCGHEPSCKGEHAYVNDDTHHWTEKCPVCEAPATEKEAHNAAVVEGEYICTVCLAELVCPETHVWGSDADSHWTEACTTCGAAATEKVPHSETRVEFVTDTAYGYECADCGYDLYTKALTDKVAAIITPGNMHNSEANAEKGNLSSSTKYQLTTSLDMTAMPYASLTGKGEVSQFLWNRATAKVGDRSAYEEYTFSVGQAKYLVIKARATMAETSVVQLHLGTVGATAKASVTLPLVKATENAGWVTYVIDLEKAYGASYAKAEGAEDYVVDTFYFHMQPFTTTDVLDVAYMAFVEGEWFDIGAYVDEDTVVAVTGSNLGSEVDADTGLCAGEHAGAVTVVDGTYKTVCTVCGHVVRDHKVSADAVNAYMPAENLYVRATETGSSASGWASITGKYNNIELVTEDGETFLRLGDAETNKATSGAWGGWFPMSNDGKNGLTNTGRYMVMKVRQNDSSVNVGTLPMWITSKEGFTSWATGSVTVSLPEDNEWHVIVVDLGARSSAFQADADGVYSLATLHIRPFGGGSAMDTPTDEVMDFAYIAFFDDMADIKGIVYDDIYEISKSNTTSSVVYTETGECVNHTPTYVTDEEDARGYHYECAECGKKFAMDYYESGKGGVFSYNNGAFAGSATLKTDEAGFSYMSFLSTGTTGTFFNYNANDTGGGGVSDNAVRAGRYLVLKLKGDTAADVTFRIGTDDIAKSNNNYQGGLAAAFTVDTMPEDWTVVVIDLKGLDKYSLGGTHKIFMSSTSGGSAAVANGAQVDLAYVMLVNDLADLADFTEGENVQYVAELEASEDVNWISSLNGMGKYSHTLVNRVCDTENGVIFNRYTGTGGNHLNITGGGGAGSATSGTFTTGKYVAVKYRLWVEGDGVTGTFGFNVATGDKKDGSGNSMGTLNYTSIEQGEWRVALMDVSGAAQWTSDGTAQSIYMMITTGGTGAYTFDIAWAAVVDSVDEMKTLLADGETYYDLGSSWADAGVEYNQDGTTVPVEVTFDANLSATVKVPANTTMNYFSWSLQDGMNLAANGEALEFVAGSMMMRQPSTFSITNDTDAAVEYTLVASYPVGSQMNPGVIVLDDYNYFSETVTLAEGDYDGYYYTFIAPADGTIKLYVSSWATTEGIVGDIVVMHGYAQKSLLVDGVDNYGLELNLDVVAGDVLTIQVIATDAEDQYANPAGDVGLCVEFAYPEGTEGNPIYPEYVWDDAYANATATVTVAAGATVYYAGTAGMILTVNGEAVEMTETGVFAITNDGEADAEYVIALATPVGQSTNPEVIEGDSFEDTNSLEADGSYYYIWTATKDGKVTLTVTDGANITADLFTYVEGEEWPTQEQFVLAEPIIDEETWNYTGWNVAEQLVIDVVAGQELKIQVNALTDWATWTTPAIDYTLTFAYEEPFDGITTIAGALAGEVGAAVKLTGTVVGFYETWSSYGNCSPYIEDAEGNQILVFRTTTQVGLGDEIAVVGEIGVYNSVNQIAQGSTVTITAPHVCSEWDEATCKAPKTCTVCGMTEGDVADHIYAEGVCTVCGAAEGVELQSATMAYTGGTTTNMTGNNDAATLGLDASVFTVIGDKGSTNNNCGLNKAGQIRLYGNSAGGNGSYFTVTAAEGYTISSIKITFGTSNKANCKISAGDTVLMTTTSSTDAVVELDVNGDSFTLQNVITGATTQVYVLSIEITYFAE